MFKVKIDMGDIAKKVEGSVEHSQSILDQQVLKDSNVYIPKDRGYLEQSSLMHTKIGTGEIVWETPYARRLYYNPQYNFSKDRNPNASGLWFEQAKSQRLKSWIEVAKKAARSKW